MTRNLQSDPYVTVEPHTVPVISEQISTHFTERVNINHVEPERRIYSDAQVAAYL